MPMTSTNFSKSPETKTIGPVEPWHTHVDMSDQEIRARAIECASRLCAPSFHLADQGETLWRLTAAFEHYITKGEKP